jgi:pimeloyl-ACP methyl ester carboxylesterase
MSSAGPRAIRVPSDRVSLEVLEWGGSADGSATAVIAMHGAVGNAMSWQEEGEAAAAGRLGATPRRFAALSRRGTGGSDTPPAGHAHDDFVNDLSRVIVALAYPRFVVIAHSFGVPTAIGAAARAPAGLVGLVLGDFGPRYPAYSDEWLARVEARDRAGDLDGVRIEGMRALRRESREIPLDGELGKIECPVLVITGTANDVLLTPEHRARYERRLRRVRVVALEGAGHMLSVDGSRESFHATVGAFLAELDARGPGSERSIPSAV